MIYVDILRMHIFAPIVPVVQWIECQIPVLMMGVRIPSGTRSGVRSYFGSLPRYFFL